ncbi:MAG: hypothetical protein AAGE52_31230 [Myxococcota bacterium]
MANVVGRWNPTVVEYLPVEEGEDDGGFSDEGFGETMDAADLLDKSDHVEFHEGGKFTGQYWGTKEEGTWKLDGTKVLVTIYGSTMTLRLRGDQLIRSDSDEEHGRDYDVYYKRAE